MKRLIAVSSFAVVVFASFNTARAQVYQFSQIDPLYGLSVSHQGIGFGDLNIANCSVSNNVTINQGAGTVQDSGSIYIPAATATLSYQQTQTLGAVFPNPPTTVTGDVSMTVSFAGGFLPFSTGTESLSYVGGTIWSFPGSAGLNIPLSISYSLATGGQTYTGSLQTTLGATIDCGSQVDIGNFPASIKLLADNGPLVTDQNDFLNINITAADGFVLNGLSVAPEPSSWGILLLGGTLGRFYIRKSRKAMKPLPKTIG